MASGDTLVTLFPSDNEPPSSNYATVDLRNGRLVLDFDAGTEETAHFAGYLPRNYAGGGLTITVKWMASSATTGDVVWGGAIEAEGTDTDADSYATEQTATTTTSGTSGIEVDTALTFTSGANMDSLAAGKRFRFKLARKAADGSDSMTGDAELTCIEIKET